MLSTAIVLHVWCGWWLWVQGGRLLCMEFLWQCFMQDVHAVYAVQGIHVHIPHVLAGCMPSCV